MFLAKFRRNFTRNIKPRTKLMARHVNPEVEAAGDIRAHNPQTNPYALEL